jgi:signal transduction histidine kinase
LQRSESALQKANDALHEKNQEMEQFVYTISHDLKSPLVTTSGFLEILKTELAAANHEAVHDAVQRMDRATKRMQELLEDLLHLSRVGLARVHIETFDAKSVVEEVVAALVKEFDAVGAKVKVDSMPTIRADRSRFREVIENLLINAIKHGCSKPGTLITIGSRELEDGWEFFVRDQGPGVEAQYQSKIFEVFERGNAKVPGTGMGLAIVAKIAQVHGGKAWVDSAPGQGATFWFSLKDAKLASDPPPS